MDADKLKKQQAILKQTYREQPESALCTMSVTGTLCPEQLCIKLPTHAGQINAGFHVAAGGNGEDACSGDMLLEALVGCAGVTLVAVATAMNIPLQHGTVTAEGDLDFRGTLGVDKEASVGFQEIRLRFDLSTPASADEVEKLVSLTERYCVIYQTLHRANRIETQITHSA